MNVYIYSDESYNPWSNTLAYYPLTSTTTVNDMSWNNHHLTNAWKVNFWGYWGVDCAYFSSWQNSWLSWLYRLNDQIAYDGMTISAWFKRITPMLHNPRILWVPNDYVWLALNYDTAQTTYNWYWNLSSATDASRQIALSTNDWCNIIIRYSTSAR